MKLFPLSETQIIDRATPREVWVHNYAAARAGAVVWRDHGDIPQARIVARTAREYLAYYLNALTMEGRL